MLKNTSSVNVEPEEDDEWSLKLNEAWTGEEDDKVLRIWEPGEEDEVQRMWESEERTVTFNVSVNLKNGRTWI
jgi:hypothetical protein